MTEPRPRSGVFGRVQRLTESDAFEGVIATLLVLNGGALLIEEMADVAAWEEWLWIFFVVSQVVFVVEILLRIVSYGPRFQDFFKDGWNLFDFAVVGVSLVPAVGPLSFLARMVRLVRVLRVLRVVSLYMRRNRRDDGQAP